MIKNRLLALMIYLLVGHTFLFFGLCVPSMASDQKVEVTWDHAVNPYLHHWLLRSNGDNSTNIVINDPAVRSWTGILPVVIGQNYLELKACSETQCSVWSNKAYFDHEGTMQEPTNLKVTIPGAEVEVSVSVKPAKTKDVVNPKVRNH